MAVDRAAALAGVFLAAVFGASGSLPGSWQVEVLLWLQSIRHPALTLIMGGVTMLGDDLFYVAVLGLMYWRASGLSSATAYPGAEAVGDVGACAAGASGSIGAAGVGQTKGSFTRQDIIDLMRIVVLSVLLNIFIKNVVAAPRPFEVTQALEGLWVFTAGGASFPSGHAQTAATFWVALIFSGKYFAKDPRKARRGIWGFDRAGTAILAVSLISISRLYLGVHWPQDVLAGAALGTILGAGGTAASKAVRSWSVFPTIVLAFIGIFVYHDEGAVQLICLLAGALYGHKQNVEGETSGVYLRRRSEPSILMLVLGLAVLVVAYGATTWLLSLIGLPEVIVDAAAALEIGLMVTWGVPALFNFERYSE